MPKLSKKEAAIFDRGTQHMVLKRVRERIPIARIATLCGCSERTFRDWQREKHPINVACLEKLARIAKLPVPKHTVRNRYAHTSEAGKKGWRTVQRKYGRIPLDEKRRQRGWEAWWQKIGCHNLSDILKPRPIYAPKKNIELAEYIGIMMGDGGLSKYQATVTLHHIDDREYGAFVVKLIQKLFRVIPATYHDVQGSVISIVVSRVELVRILHQLGLPIGNKVAQRFDIPSWIKKKKSYLIACMRGLFDTDGCVIIHRYRVKDTLYAYKKLSFCSRSAPLLKSVYGLLAELGMKPRYTRDGYEVRLESRSDVQKYFKIIGSHNPKHLKKCQKRSTIQVQGAVA